MVLSKQRLRKVESNMLSWDIRINIPFHCDYLMSQKKKWKHHSNMESQGNLKFQRENSKQLVTFLCNSIFFTVRKISITPYLRNGYLHNTIFFLHSLVFNGISWSDFSMRNEEKALNMHSSKWAENDSNMLAFDTTVYKLASALARPHASLAAIPVWWNVSHNP